LGDGPNDAVRAYVLRNNGHLSTVHNSTPLVQPLPADRLWLSPALTPFDPQSADPMRAEIPFLAGESLLRPWNIHGAIPFG